MKVKYELSQLDLEAIIRDHFRKPVSVRFNASENRDGFDRPSGGHSVTATVTLTEASKPDELKTAQFQR